MEPPEEPSPPPLHVVWPCEEGEKRANNQSTRPKRKKKERENIEESYSHVTYNDMPLHDKG